MTESIDMFVDRVGTIVFVIKVTILIESYIEESMNILKRIVTRLSFPLLVRSMVKNHLKISAVK